MRMHGAGAEPGSVIEVGCWSHVRPPFLDLYKSNGSPIAKEALERIGVLFDIERPLPASRQTCANRFARGWPNPGSRSWPPGSINNSSAFLDGASSPRRSVMHVLVGSP